MITFTLNACPKPTFKRGAPKRGKQGTFDAKTRKCIINRDKGLCVRCGAPYSEIHHVIFRSAGGPGTVDNGVCVCKTCHDSAHSKRAVREWFEQFRLRLLEQGVFVNGNNSDNTGTIIKNETRSRAELQ